MDDDIRRKITLGREHYAAREFDKAEPYLTVVVEKQRGFADVFNMLGVIYHGQGRFPKSQQAFEEALRINPNYTEAALNLSIVYNDLGKYQEARDVYMKAMARSQASPRALDSFARGKIANMHADLGAVYAGAGLYPEAVGEFRKALDLCPQFHDLRTRLAQIYRDAGDLAAAVTELEAVKASVPDYVPARVALGVTYHSLKKPREAAAEWKAALELDPDNKPARVFLDMTNEDQA